MKYLLSFVLGMAIGVGGYMAGFTSSQIVFIEIISLFMSLFIIYLSTHD